MPPRHIKVRFSYKVRFSRAYIKCQPRIYKVSFSRPIGVFGSAAFQHVSALTRESVEPPGAGQAVTSSTGPRRCSRSRGRAEAVRRWSEKAGRADLRKLWGSSRRTEPERTRRSGRAAEAVAGFLLYIASRRFGWSPRLSTSILYLLQNII